MNKITELLKQIPITYLDVLILVIIYLVMRDILPHVPYINLMTNGLAGKLVVLWIAFILLTRLSANNLLFMSGIVLGVHFLTVVWGINVEGQSFGLLIYISLVFFTFKIMKENR